MPVINNMTKVYIGATPASKVYAGTKEIWPRRLEGVKQYASGAPWGLDRTLWMVVIPSDMAPVDCTTAGQQYAYRVKGGMNGDTFSSWYQWDQTGYFGWWSGITNVDSNSCEVWMGIVPAQAGDPGLYAIEFRRVINGLTYNYFIDYGEAEDWNSLPIYNPTTGTTNCAYNRSLKL